MPIKHGRSVRGMTMLEVLMGLFIVGLIGGLAMISVRSFLTNSALELAARQIKASLEEARERTLSTQHRHQVVFLVSDQSYHMDEETSAGTFVQLRRFSVPKGTEISDVADITVLFNLSGGLASPNNLSIHLVNSAGTTGQLTILNTTGRVRIL